MSQIVIPNGFELVSLLSWDDLPASLRGGRRAGLFPAVIDACDFPAVSARQADQRLIDEDSERWDGLS